MKIELSSLHLDKITGILNVRIMDCQAHRQEAVSTEEQSYWTQQQAEAEGLREYLRASRTLDGVL